MPKEAQKKVRHLTAENRKVIAELRKLNFSQVAIGKIIGFSQSAVSKELERNRGQRGYRPKQAQEMSEKRQNEKMRRSRVMIGAVREEVETRIQLKHSPEQISNRLKREGVQVSHTTIYNHVAEDRKSAGSLYRHLRFNGKRRYRFRTKERRGEKIKNRVDITERPTVVNERLRYGDWEADLIQGAGHSGFLLSVWERKSRLGKLYKLETKTSDAVADAMIGILKEFAVETITYDNGLEFAQHELINEVVGSLSYFCKPYHSWEKGGVENYNGLVRQYFRKGTDFTEITQERLEEVAEEINNRPRKILGYDTPNEYLDELKKK